MSLTQKYALAFKLVQNPSKMVSTSSFRTIGRDNKPSYASRYVRDFNDLDYRLPSSFSPKKKSLNSQHKIQFKKKSQDPEKQHNVFKISPSKSHHKKIPSGIQSNAYGVKDLFKSTGMTIDTQNNQYRHATKSLVSSTKALEKETKDFGLCGFQFEKTIIGKIEKRDSHHIKFEKSPKRQENINRIYYSKDFQLCADKLQTKKKSQGRIHNFKSDSAHKAFAPKQTLFKFYDIQGSINLVKQRSDLGVQELKKLTDRPQLTKKLGTNLDYEKSRSLQNNKKPIFQIEQNQRKLIISRQVISAERGCYR